jgi:hypothetical protein
MTLAHEKLTEQHGLRLSRESVRKLMLDAGIWQAKTRNSQRYFFASLPTSAPSLRLVLLNWNGHTLDHIKSKYLKQNSTKPY